jgi:hypothetical protein
MVLASILALLLALAAGVGAPSSEFAPKDSVWWTLDPLMWPALFGGVVLAVVAVIASAAAGVRAAAILCFLASASTATGIIVAAGTSDRRDLVFYGVNVAVVAIPAVVAVIVLTRPKTR